MPMTINGVGTHYWGKRNPREYPGTCESCRNESILTDYETSHFFVVLFIPVIPLGKKQIISECSYCHRHRVMSLHKWQETSERAVDEGLATLSEAMEDPKKALELLGTMDFFNRTEEAHELALATHRTFDDDIDVQLSLAGYFTTEEMPAEADECLNLAIKIDPTHPGSLRAAGFDLMEEGKVHEAAEKLNPLRPPSPHYDLGLFMRLAMKMTEVGDHDGALAEYQQLMNAFPELAKDKSFRKEVKQAEDGLGRQQSILPKRGWFG